MRKLLRRVCTCLLIVFLILVMGLVSDREKLKDSLIRFHVVANSDSRKDQDVKLLVRDAVLQSIQDDLSQIADIKQAKAYLQENLPKIESIANRVLKTAGFEESAVVSLCKEAFSIREYETFTLPSGVYESLRIVIGEGQGQNWWCVSFPNLCLPATSESFVETASKSEMPKYLAQTLSNEGDMDIHFFLLDAIGRIENRIFQKG